MIKLEYFGDNKTLTFYRIVHYLLIATLHFPEVTMIKDTD